VETDVRKFQRLYLDTSDLLDIADGRTPTELLLSTMEATRTLLVVSRAHAQDAIAPGDDVARERFIRALELFGTLLLVVDGPLTVEPLVEGVDDINVEPCSNIREILLSEGSAAWLNRERDWQEEMHLASQRSAVRLATIPPAKQLRKAVEQLGWQCAITMIRGWLSDDPQVIVEYWQAKSNLELSPKERDRILTAMRAMAELLEPVRKLQADQDTVDFQLRRWASAFGDAKGFPGSMLSHGVAWELSRDRKRKRLRSDHVDVDHVAHIPYVDIATCDRAVIHMMRPYLAKIHARRGARVIRSGHIQDVIVELRKQNNSGVASWQERESTCFAPDGAGTSS
jgi:hypothetical protein